jgi:Raf kinase inhibitor-like YbhB/YbcL family protein
MKITSPAFSEGDIIPRQFARDSGDKSPPLHIEDVPAGAKSLALIVDDPDAPSGTFNHWILFNIDPKTKEIREDCPPVMASQGRNDWGETHYDGPKPPSGEHRYFFRLYALDTVLSLPRGARRDQLEAEMKGHILEEAELMGRYAVDQMATVL